MVRAEFDGPGAAASAPIFVQAVPAAHERRSVPVIGLVILEPARLLV